MIRHGGELVVSSGGVAGEATVIGRGGLELVMSGGVASGAIVDRGGTLEFAASDTGITQDIPLQRCGRGRRRRQVRRGRDHQRWPDL